MRRSFPPCVGSLRRKSCSFIVPSWPPAKVLRSLRAYVRDPFLNRRRKISSTVTKRSSFTARMISSFVFVSPRISGEGLVGSVSITLDPNVRWVKGVIVRQTNQRLTPILTPVEKHLPYGSGAAKKMPRGDRAVLALSLKKGCLAQFNKVAVRKPFG